MAVLGRTLFSSAERLDLPDLLGIDSYVGGDFKYLIQSMVGGTRPYILKGFELINPSASINTPNISINVADSIVYYPGSNAGSFFFGLPTGNPLSEPLIPELRTGSISADTTNYVYLTFDIQNGAADNRAFWDPDANGGAGGEFEQSVQTESILVANVNVSVSTFPANTIPICVVVMGPTNIKSIEDRRDMMFRLGTGGLNPNPFSSYNFRSLPDFAHARLESPGFINNSGNPNPFEGGDKNIYSMKEWMDVVMTRIKEIGGTTFWYQESGIQGNGPSVQNVFQDVLGSTLKSKGDWQHSGSTPGLVTWSEDIVYQNLNDPRDIIIRQGNVTVQDGELAYIEMIRDADINPSATPVDFIGGVDYINGPVGAFANLKQGDWIKKKTDPNSFFLRVEKFFALPGKLGGSAVPALAASIQLSDIYAGSTATTQAIYTKGSYPLSDVMVSTRDDPALQILGGNFFWLVSREDTVVNVAGIVSTTLSVVFSDGDGVRLKGTSAAHGLSNGDRITVGGGVLPGTYVVDVIDVNTFYITSSVLSASAQPAYYATVTTAAVVSTVGSFPLESANHGLENNETVHLTGTTGFNGAYQVNVHSGTTFQIPIPSAILTQGAGGKVDAPRVEVRKSFGAIRIVQGESIQIDEIDGANIQAYIGMHSLSETSPTYSTPLDSGTLYNYENFNSASDDNLTIRISRLTSMMGDRVQDRSIKILNAVVLRNTTSGGNQVITANTTATIEKPYSPSVETVTLSSTLPVNTVATVTIDRNAGGALTTTIESIGSNLLLAENKFILFYRLSGSDVYTWDGNIIPPNGTYTINSTENIQNKNISVVNGNNLSFNNMTGQVQIDVINTPTENIKILIPGSTNDNTLDVDAINAYVWGGGTGLVVADGESVWVRVDRTAAKTFNVISGTDVPDTTGAGAVYITARSAVPLDQDVFVLWSRAGNSLTTTHEARAPHENVYDETMLIVNAPSGDHQHVPCLAGTSITLPSDLRDNGNAQYYLMGQGALEIYLNGQYLTLGVDWLEQGLGVGYTTNLFQIQRDLVAGDSLTFRDDTDGGVFFSTNSAPSVTLQTAYNAGRTITTTLGNPVVIDGNAGDKLLWVEGDMQVDGVIDPAGITFSDQVANPLPGGTNGLWANTGNELVYSRSGVDKVVVITDADAVLSSLIINQAAEPTGAALTVNITNALNATGVIAISNVGSGPSIFTAAQTGVASEDLSIATGASDTLSGSIVIYSGDTTGGNTGQVTLISGTPTADGFQSGDIHVTSGAISANSAISGALSLNSGDTTGTNSTTGNVSVYTGGSQGSGNSGLLFFSTGAAAAGNSGDINIATGNGVGGTAGSININMGSGDFGGGNVTVTAGTSVGGLGGTVSLSAGSSGVTAGDVVLNAGSGTAFGANGGSINITSGDSNDATSGDVNLSAGVTDAPGAGGNINIVAGYAFAGGTNGSVFIAPGHNHGFGGNGTRGNVEIDNLKMTTYFLVNIGNVITSAHAITVDDYLVRVDTTGGAFTATLPTSTALNKGQVIVVKDVGGMVATPGNALTIAPNGADTIDGANASIIANFVNYLSITFVADGAGGWMIV